MRSRCRRILATLAFVALSPVVAVGQPAKVGIVTTLEGNVTARRAALPRPVALKFKDDVFLHDTITTGERSEEHTSELQSLTNLVCRLLLEKKKRLPHEQQARVL